MIQFYNACRGKPGKTHVIARKQSYHGSTFAAISIGNKSSDRVPEFRYLQDGIHHVSAPYQYRDAGDRTEAEFLADLLAEFEDKILEIGPDKIGGFFAEPVMGAGGVIVAPDGYFKAMAEICRKYDILFIADEVVTAWGRLGHWFASYDEFGVIPDIICTAKGLSSGYLPIGAMIYSDRIHEVIASENPDRWYASGYTYSAHPVCCAAAMKNIEILEREEILANARDVGTYFEQQLQSLRDLPVVGDVRGKKMMMCVENVQDKASKALFSDEVNIGKHIANQAEALGLIVRPIGHLNVMSPPLILTREQVDFTVDTLRTSISTVTDQLTREGLMQTVSA